MKTARPLLALAALVLVSGCSDSESLLPCAPPPSSGSGGPLVPHYIVAQGEQVSLDVSAAPVQSLSSCGDEDRPTQAPQSAAAQVFDPDNHPVPAEVSLSPDRRKAHVSFHPTVPGRHHVIVSFAPVGSLQQLTVHVARPWSGQGSGVLLPLPRCAQLDRTSRGTWVCDGVALREPGGRQVRLGSSSTPPDVAISGNIVWVVGDGRVRRYVDTGTELELTGSLLLNPQAPVTEIQSRLATQSELWVLGMHHLHRFTFTDTGVLTTGPAVLWATGPLTSFGLDGVRGLLVRSGEDRVLLVQVHLVQGPGFVRFDTLACPFALTPGPAGGFAATNEPCQPIPSAPVGYEEGVLWTASRPDSQTLHRWELSEGKLVERASMVLGQLMLPFAPLRAGFTVPAVRPPQPGSATIATPVHFPQDTTLGLEQLPDTPLTAVTALSPRYYFHGTTDAQPGPGTLVYERPAP